MNGKKTRGLLLLPAFLSALFFMMTPVQAQSVNARNLIKLARSAADQGDWESAKTYAERAMKEEPGYLDALYMRAFAYRELEQYDKAEADFKEVIRQDEKYLPTYGALAETYLKQKKYDKADEVFVQLGKQPDGQTWASYYRGVLAYLRSDLDAAEKFWSDVLARDTNFAPAHHNLGALYLAKGNNTRALASFREALDEKPDKPLYRFHVAWALERTDQVPAAQQMLRKIMDENPDDQMNWLLARGLDRITKKQYDTAVEVLKTVAEQHPDNLDVWILLGRAYSGLNKPEEAREALTKAKELDQAFQEIDTLLSKLPKPPEPEPAPSSEATPQSEVEPAQTPTPAIKPAQEPAGQE